MDILGLGLIQTNDYFLWFIIILTALYLYLTWDFQHFEKRGIPGPKPVPLFGTFFPVMQKGTHEVDLENMRKYGKIYGTFEGRTPNLMISDPDMIRDFMVKEHSNFINRPDYVFGKIARNMLPFTTGDNWKVLRSTVSPTFSTAKLKQMTQQMNECADNLVQNLAKEAESGNHMECKEYAGAFSMDAIASMAFGLKLDSQKDKKHTFVQMAKKGLNVFGKIQVLFLFFPFLSPILKYFQIDLTNKDVADFFKEITDQIFERRKELNEKRTDLLQLMINAHMETGRKDTEHDQDFYEQHGKTEKRRLTKDEVLAQGITFFMAGYETTATTISFAMYALALNPEIQEKLHEEIVNVAENKEIDYDVLNEMTLLDMCIHETLRMYPPGARHARTCNKETVLKGIRIEKGQRVTAPVYAIQRDPKIWPEPEKFNPYRFSKEEKAKHTPYDWMPFGSGPRNCVAMRLALTESKLAIAHIVKHYKLIRGPKTEVPIQLSPYRLLKAKNGIWIKIEKR